MRSLSSFFAVGLALTALLALSPAANAYVLVTADCDIISPPNDNSRENIPSSIDVVNVGCSSWHSAQIQGGTANQATSIDYSFELETVHHANTFITSLNSTGFWRKYEELSTTIGFNPGWNTVDCHSEFTCTDGSDMQSAHSRFKVAIP